MKFICNGLILSEAVIKVSKACAIRTPVPVMECIKLEAYGEEVTLLATDGELSISRSVQAEILEEGAICVPGKLFADFIGKLTGEEVSVTTTEKGLEIGYREAISYIQTLDAEEFPKLNLQVGENSVVLKKSVLKKIIAQTTFCCAQDDSRPVLKGCLMEFGDKLEAVALDGYRLACTEAEILSKSESKSIICPARTLNEISRMLSDDDEEISIFTQGGMLMVCSEGTTVLSRLYTGTFIKKEDVIPKKFTTLVDVERSALIATVERAAILIRGEKNNLVTFSVMEGNLRISSSSDFGKLEESVPVSVEGFDLIISMNAKYLLDALKALDEDTVTISFNGATSPFILQNKEKKEGLYLILPVRNVQ